MNREKSAIEANDIMLVRVSVSVSELAPQAKTAIRTNVKDCCQRLAFFLKGVIDHRKKTNKKTNIVSC